MIQCLLKKRREEYDEVFCANYTGQDNYLESRF